MRRELYLQELLKGREGRPCLDRAGGGGPSTTGEQGLYSLGRCACTALVCTMQQTRGSM